MHKALSPTLASTKRSLTSWYNTTMSKRALFRIFKAFIISSVAVYTFINGPTLYANAQFWFKSVNKLSDESKLAVIRPIRLPLSDIDEQPLPNQATLTIEKINVSVPIVFGISTDTKAIYDNLIKGVVHYSATAKPGQGGASIVMCHSSLYPWQYSPYGAPCALLNKLQLGDRITVRYSDGRVFNYTMEESLVFDPLTGKDNDKLAEFEHSTKPTLFLVTCYPTNSAKYRITVKSVLD